MQSHDHARHRNDDYSPSLGDLPHNLDAERGVIGAMLFDNDVINDVVMRVDVDDFFRDVHQIVYKAIVDIYSSGSTVDCVILADELTRRKVFHKVGGDDTLTDIASSVPHAANALHYSAIVHQKAVVRKLIQASIDTIKECQSNLYTANQLLDSTERRVFAVAEQRASSSTVGSDKIVGDVLEKIEKAKSGGEVFGISTGFPDLDEKIGGMKPGQLIILAARPGVGKTALALNIAENRASKEYSTLFVSLEMEAIELGYRLISAKGGVDSRRMTNNEDLTPAEDVNVKRAAAAIRKARLRVDDAPGQSLIRIAANARRWKQRDNLSLLVIDYLGLINETATRNQNTVDVLTKISNGLKNLAKELKIPILALHQLNRASENEERPPRKSDLRGCLTRDTTIYCALSGRLRTVGDYVDANESPVVYGINETGFGRSWRIVKSVGDPFWSTGIQPVFKMRTKSGRTIRCTANHPFRTLSGWAPLESLCVGQRIAVPRYLPAPTSSGRESVGMNHDRAKLIGYLISDGSYIKHRTVSYVKGELALVSEVERIAWEQFGIIAKDHAHRGDARDIMLTGPGTGPGSNPLINWLKDMGILGQKGENKRVPACMFAERDETIAAFIGALWAGDGCVVRRKTGGWHLKFCSTSMKLLEEVQMLLLRLGIVSVLGKPGRNSNSKKDIATIYVSDSRQVVRFSDRITIPGIKGRKLRVAAGECRDMNENSHVDRLPLELNEMIVAAKESMGHSWTTLGYRVQGKEIGREALAGVATTLDDNEFADLSTSDILWDAVESITPDGAEEVFDTRVPGVHNFVAGGMCVHNSGSIEQDADVILLLHTKMTDSDVAGVVDVIIAKNRSGPTGVESLWFNKPFNRFESMAKPGQVRDAEPQRPDPPLEDFDSFESRPF